MKVCSCSPQRQKNQSYLFWLPRTSLPWPRPCWITTLGRALQWDFSCSLPDYRHYSPPPTKCLKRVCDRRRNKWHRTGWLLARAGLFPPVAKLCLWYMCFCAEVFFFCSTLYSPMEHSLGVIFFSLFPHVNAVFSSIPCLPVLSTPLSDVCCVCMNRLMANSLALVTSDNKGLLLLLLFIYYVTNTFLPLLLHIDLYQDIMSC